MQNPLTKILYWPIANHNHGSNIPKTISVSYKGTATDEQAYVINKIEEESLCSGIIYMKTGKGKTHIIFMLMQLFQCSTLILCHNIKVAHETKEKLIWFTSVQDKDISLLTSKSSDKGIKKITITTHKNFKDNYPLFQGNFTQIIYDECDVNISFPDRNNRGHCMTNCIILSDADIIRGLTWTPYRDNLGSEPLEALFWKIITMPDQLWNWYNMIPDINQVLYPSKPYIRNTRSELVKEMSDDTKRREAQINQIKINHRKYSLVLFDSRYECDIFEEELQKHIVKSISIIKIYWWLSSREAAEKWSLLSKSNSYIIVGTTDMMWRWIDIPSIDTIFMYSALKFKWTIVQAVGRCLRMEEWKLAPVIVDWCDVPLLNKQMRERTKSYKQEYWQDVLITKTKYNVLI